jgi:hypothetical protein
MVPVRRDHGPWSGARSPTDREGVTTHVSVNDNAPAAVRVPWANRVTLWLVGHGMGGRRLVGLRYTARTGARVTLPVEGVRDGDRVVAMVAHADRKRWWRHFRTAAPIEVLLDGRWWPGTAAVATDGEATACYRRALPRTEVGAQATFVVATLDERPAPAAPLRGRRLTRTWFWTVTAAEFVGFAVPAAAGAVTADARPLIVVPAILAAGMVEGSLLGWGQSRVLGRAVPGLPRRRWVLATALAAAFAYAIGLIPSTVSFESWPVALTIAVGAGLGTVLLASIGFAQWLILRRFVARAGRWIATTALAWLVGLGVFLGFATPLWHEGQPVALTVTIGVAGGLLMAATTSAITGVALTRLLRGYGTS